MGLRASIFAVQVERHIEPLPHLRNRDLVGLVGNRGEESHPVLADCQHEEPRVMRQQGQ
jgi:hypothetical protein